MSETPFLHRRCAALVCDDCRAIADEYAELLDIRTRALMEAQRKLEETQQELKAEKDLAAMWRQVSELGLNEIIKAWLADVAVKAFNKGRRDMRAEFAAFNEKLEAMERKTKQTMKGVRND